jgi:hypothetical protein
MSDLDRPSETPIVPARKRVVAREVESENVESASLPAEIISPPPALPVEEPVEAAVVDPTALGGRRRRSSHHRVYRWTQVLTMLAALAGATSVICTMVDEPIIGRYIAFAALPISIFAIVLSTRNSLAQRWRGWAVAACVFVIAALCMTWIHERVVHEPEPARPARKPEA